MFLPEHRAIKRFHQLGGCFVAYIPQADHNARRAGIHEAASESHQTLSANVFSEPGSAAAQYHELGRQVEIEDFVGSQEPVFFPALPINERKNDSGKLGVLAVHETMRCKMNVPILAQFRACSRGS